MYSDSDGDGFGNACDGDLDQSGAGTTVGFADLAEFGARFGQPSDAPDFNPADFDCSGGIVNFEDLGLFGDLFGTTPGPSGQVD